MAEHGEEEAATLEFTPTWIVALVCSIIVLISLLAERCLHYLGKTFRRKNQKPLYEAILKVKEGKSSVDVLEAIHQLHIFIFVLAITHVVFSVLTMLLGGAKIHQWKLWEDAIQKDTAGNGPKKVNNVRNFEFIREHFKGIGKDSRILSWLVSNHEQFYGSVSKTDYTTMRLGFIMTHCRGNLKFDFHKYMLRVLESDFKKLVLVGLRGDLSVADVNDSKIELDSLAVTLGGTHTLDRIHSPYSQLAQDVAEKHSAVEGDLIVKPSDDHFWFGRPRIVLFLIHFILFQNAFEIAFFFWILTTYGFNSCIMGQVGFIVPRLVIGLIIQLLCSYSTLPLYAIVTQMGSFYKKEIFNEHVQQGVLGWAQKAKMKKGFKKSNGPAESTGAVNSAGPSAKIEMMKRPAREGNDAPGESIE
ncbi:seven trans-membrane protein [Hordeum vulgare]|nr:seven trans-membrane protein [Hordeum vulgare]